MNIRGTYTSKLYICAVSDTIVDDICVEIEKAFREIDPDIDWECVDAQHNMFCVTIVEESYTDGENAYTIGYVDETAYCLIAEGYISRRGYDEEQVFIDYISGCYERVA